MRFEVKLLSLFTLHVSVLLISGIMGYLTTKAIAFINNLSVIFNYVAE
jgi:hypothetical protein